MSRYANNVVDEYGAPIKGVSVYVYNRLGALAPLTNDATLPLANPVITDDDGGFYFNTADGLYSLQFWAGGKKRFTDQQVVVGGGIPLPVEILTALGASNGASLVGESSGSGNVQAALNARVPFATFNTFGLSDLGYATLQAAVDAATALNAPLNVSRNWTTATTVNLTCSLNLLPQSSIAMTTNNTRLLDVSGQSGIRITGTGRLVGTNTETFASSLVRFINSPNCFVGGGVRIQNARFGIESANACHFFTLDGVTFYGATAVSGVTSEADYFGSAPGASPSMGVRINRCLSLGNQKVGIYPNSNGGEPDFIVSNCYARPMQADGLTPTPKANVTRQYHFMGGYTGGTGGRRQFIGNVADGAACIGFNNEFAADPAGTTIYTNNIANECGFGLVGSGATLRGGFFFQNAGNVVGSGNIAISCYQYGFTSKWSNGQTLATANTGRIMWDGFQVLKLRRQIQGAGTGIAQYPVYLEDASRVVMSNFHLDGRADDAGLSSPSAAYCVFSRQNMGDIKFADGACFGRGINVEAFATGAGNADIADPVVIENVTVEGIDTATVNILNSGFALWGNTRLRSVKVSGCYYGTVERVSTLGGRRLDLERDGIEVSNCTVGVTDDTGTGNGMILYERTRFKNVTTPYAGGIVCVPGERLGPDNVRISSQTVPAAMPFKRGDEMIYPQPSASGFRGLVWVADGTGASGSKTFATVSA